MNTALVMLRERCVQFDQMVAARGERPFNVVRLEAMLRGEEVEDEDSAEVEEEEPRRPALRVVSDEEDEAEEVVVNDAATMADLASFVARANALAEHGMLR